MTVKSIILALVVKNNMMDQSVVLDAVDIVMTAIIR